MRVMMVQVKKSILPLISSIHHRFSNHREKAEDHSHTAYFCFISISWRRLTSPPPSPTLNSIHYLVADLELELIPCDVIIHLPP